VTPEEQEYLKTIALFAAGAGVVGGAVVSAVAILFNGWRQRVADAERHRADTEVASIRHFRELALEAAIADWKHHLEISEKWIPGTTSGGNERPKVDPFDYFLIKKLKTIQTFGDGKITSEQLPLKWEEMADFHDWFRRLRSKNNAAKIQAQSEQ
jgi:hypothetical protein